MKKEFNEEELIELLKMQRSIQQKINTMVKRKKKSTSIWLVIFLGWMGAHRFYTGRYDLAVAMLLLALISPATPFVLLFLIPMWVIDIILVSIGYTIDNNAQKLV